VSGSEAEPIVAAFHDEAEPRVGDRYVADGHACSGESTIKEFAASPDRSARCSIHKDAQSHLGVRR
jgi:hypothetical protein